MLLAPEEGPSPVRSVETEEELRGLLKESTATDLWQTGQSETYTDCLYHSPAHPNLRHVHAGADESWNLRFGEKTLGED